MPWLTFSTLYPNQGIGGSNPGTLTNQSKERKRGKGILYGSKFEEPNDINTKSKAAMRKELAVSGI